MKKFFAVALFAAMAVVCGPTASRAAADKAAMDLEPMRQKLCSGKAADMVDMLYSNVEFDIRVEYMMSDGREQPIADVLADAKDRLSSQNGDFDMKLDKCVLVKKAPMECEEGARVFAPLFASMYASEEQADLTGVQANIVKALGEMGVTQCGTAELSATVGTGGMAETINVKFFIGKKAEGWTPLMEMDEPGSETTESN